MAILSISLDLDVVRPLSDRIVVMYQGEVVDAEEKRHIHEQPVHEYTRQLLDAIPKH